ncbi:MAG: TonB-dependent receptor, partial [Desulfuromonas sp.]|nr:TonB-dependent receptor [Desulfuromonas sp.]
RTPEHLNEVAQSVTIIDRADIDGSAADSVADLLEYASGVDVRQRAGHGVQSDVSIRGGSYEQTLVMLNGISLSNPQTGHHNMDIPVSLADIERIEIIKGPGARIYGANAMAGVINIITRRQTTPSVSAQLKVGEYDYLVSAVQSHFATGNWQNSLSASQQYSSGFEQDEPTGFNIKTVNYQGRGEIGAQELELGAAYTDKKFGASRFYFNAPYQKEKTETFIGYLAANLQHGSLNWRPQASWTHHEDLYTSAYGTNDTDTDKYAFQITGDSSCSWGNSTFGVSTEREEMESSNLGDHDRDNYSLFLNHKIAVTDELTLGAGASAIYYSDWGWEYWPGAEASYKISRHLQWFASVAKAFRIPTYLEMYYNTPSNIGDPNLEPEEAWSWESGLRWQQKRLSANLSLFLRDSDNLIDWSRASADEPWRVRNVAESTTTGIEVGFDLKQPVAAIPLLGRLAVSYTYLDHDADSGGLESKYSLDNLRHQLHGSVWLDWHPKVSHVIKARVEERMFGDSSVVFDTKISYQLNQAIELSLEASNLLDEDYIESGDAPMPGRWVMAGISIQHEFL